MKARKGVFIFILALLFITLACGISFGGQSEAEQTLQAIYVQQTIDAEQLPAEAEPAEPVAEEPTSTVEIIHTITPGQPGWVSQHSRSKARKRGRLPKPESARAAFHIPADGLSA